MKTKFLILILLICFPASLRMQAVPAADNNQEWKLISDKTTATVYNAVPAQCNEDCLHTASMFVIIPEKVGEYRIIAMERTMMTEFDISYGDTVFVTGAGRYDGKWQVQDIMNQRFAGQHRIDFLVPENITHGHWNNVRIYKQNSNFTQI